METAAPLAGLRVLDLSTVVAGPFGSEILGHLGADVIRIDPPPAEVPPAPTPAGKPVSDADGFFWALQRNKRSLCLDLKKPAGAAVFRDLVRQADIVYDNFRPGVLKRLGIDYPALSAINPRIISCSLTGYGSQGPWAEVGAYDVTVQALSGAMSITGTGDADGFPCRWGVPIGDIGGALYAVIGLLAALESRAATGRGQAVEISLFDVQLALHTYRVPQAFGAGIEFAVPSPRRGGAGTVPYGPFRCGDGAWLVIGVATNFWARFCEVVGAPQWREDPRFATLKDRQRHQDALDALVEARLATDTAAAWERRLADAGIPVGKVNTIAEAFTQPQAVARGMTVELREPGGRPVQVAGSPLRFAGESVGRQQPPARRGADSVSILHDVLGYDAARIAALRGAGVIDGGGP